MIDFSRNHFELFGLPERFQFDAALLDRAYHRLQGEVHPDRYAAAGATEQRLALQSSARVNEAYQALKDPVARAQYLLLLHGVDALAETDTCAGVRFPGTPARAARSCGRGGGGRRRRALEANLDQCAPRRGSSKSAFRRCSTSTGHGTRRAGRCVSCDF
jgi:molecular chaperone HscB